MYQVQLNIAQQGGPNCQTSFTQHFKVSESNVTFFLPQYRDVHVEDIIVFRKCSLHLIVHVDVLEYDCHTLQLTW